MDIVRRRQRVEPRKDLFQKKAKEKIKNLIQNAKACFFCMDKKNKKPFEALPVPVQGVDRNGNIWCFLPAPRLKKRKKSDENFVQLLFHGASFSDFLLVTGIADHPESQEIIKEFWKSSKKSWVKEGVKDMRHTLVKVIPTDAYCWDGRRKKIIQLPKKDEVALDAEAFDRKINLG